MKMSTSGEDYDDCNSDSVHTVNNDNDNDHDDLLAVRVNGVNDRTLDGAVLLASRLLRLRLKIGKLLPAHWLENTFSHTKAIKLFSFSPGKLGRQPASHQTLLGELHS